MPGETTINGPRLRRAEVIAIVGFLAANVIVPLVWGDVFPFTTAPMFRDAPRAYCIYRVFTPNRIELPAADFLLQRVYDGNPPGYGVGIQPPQTLAVFGETATEDQVRRHVAAHYAESAPDEIIVEQQVIAPLDDYRVGAQPTNRYRISRPGARP